MIPLLYALVTSGATIFGGLLPLSKTFQHVELRYLVGFASGAVISIAFFDMLPEMGVESPLMLAIGFFATYLIEKLVLIHTCEEAECESHTIGLVALIGIGLESLIDGVAIAIGFSVAPALGLSIAIAVCIHEVPRGFSTTVIMKQSQYRLLIILMALGVDALFTPLGALVGWLLPSALFKHLIGFAAGTFLYIGASDLLPEAHRRFNIKVVLSVLSGALLMPLLGQLTGR